MQNKIPKYTSIIKQSGKIFNGLWIFISIIAISLFIYTVVIGFFERPDEIIPPSQEITNTACKITPKDEAIILPKSELSTISSIALIDTEELYKTKLDKNDVSAIFDPRFSDFEELDNCLNDDDEVVIVTINDTSHIYPVKLLNHHLIINDSIKGNPILITKCLLCNYVQVYQRENNNEILFFGHSGLLYKNDDLLYDSKTDSLWTQINGKAVVGTYTGEQLEIVPFTTSTYKESIANFPDAKILSFDSGYHIDYFTNSIDEFNTNNEIVGPIINNNNEIPLKTEIVGFHYGDKTYALKKSSIPNNSKFNENYEDNTISIINQDNEVSVFVNDEELTEDQIYQMFWYVFYDFFPDSIIID